MRGSLGIVWWLSRGAALWHGVLNSGKMVHVCGCDLPIYIYISHHIYCTLKGGKLALQAVRYYQEIHPASDQISPVFILPQSNMLHLNKTIIYLRLNYQMETCLDGYGPTPVPWF